MTPGPKTTLEHTVNWYSENYGIPYYRIIAYRRQGYPLDDPARLMEIIKGHKGKKAPMDRLQRFIAEGPEDLSPPVNGNGNGNGRKPTKKTLANRKRKESARTLITSQIEFLEEEVERVRDDYLATPNHMVIDKASKWKTLNEQIKTLAALAKAAPGAEIEAGNSLKRSEVEGTWSRFMKEARVALDAMPRRVALLPIFKKVDPVEVEEILGRERDQILRILAGGSAA